MFSIESVYKSAIKQVQTIRNQLIAAGISTDMKYYAWDARGQETELPKTDLIGIAGWSYEENEGLPVIQIGIVISMLLDQNQFREVQAMDFIRNTFVGSSGDYKTMALVTPNDNQEYSVLQVTAFEIMPAGRSEIRSTRNIAVEFIRSSGD